jgi:lysophospholipase L1-like esterase
VIDRRSLVAVPVLVSMLGACGLGDRSSGVQTVSAAQSGEDVRLVVEAPEPVSSQPSVVADADQANEVETLVVPVMSRPATVAVVGDSLTLSAEDEIMSALSADGLQVLVIDGLESRRMARGSRALTPGTEAVENIRRVVEPGLWVIALGTNDVASVESADGFRDEMRDVLALIPAEAPVVWVDLWIRDREDAISAANLMIRSELRRRRGGSAVVDWYSHGQEDGIITGDGVHLTQSGQDLFAASIATAIDELFDAG